MLLSTARWPLILSLRRLSASLWLFIAIAVFASRIPAPTLLPPSLEGALLSWSNTIEDDDPSDPKSNPRPLGNRLQNPESPTGTEPIRWQTKRGRERNRRRRRRRRSSNSRFKPSFGNSGTGRAVRGVGPEGEPQPPQFRRFALYLLAEVGSSCSSSYDPIDCFHYVREQNWRQGLKGRRFHLRSPIEIDHFSLRSRANNLGIGRKATPFRRGGRRIQNSIVRMSSCGKQIEDLYTTKINKLIPNLFLSNLNERIRMSNILSHQFIRLQ